MTDPSQLTDEQLLAIIGGQPQQPSASRQAQPRPQSGVSRGERNANQGNIKDGPFARRQPGYAGSDGTFARFETPEAGNAAQVALLANNYIGAGFDTPAAIVNRYAPPGPENSPESVASYTNYIASSLGIGPNDRVSPQQAEALAQAMREFETGNTRPVSAQGQPAAPDLTQMPDAELLAMIQTEGAQNAARMKFDRRSEVPDLGEWSPWLAREPRYLPPPVEQVDENGNPVIVVDRGNEIIDLGNGQFEIFDEATNAAYPATADEVDMLRRRRAGQNQKRREEQERRDDPTYQAAYSEQRAKSENVPAWLANLTTGASVGGIQEIIAGLGALNPGEGVSRDIGSQAARDAWRDRQATLLQEDPTGTIGLQLAGGLITPGVKGSGDWIAGATGAARTGRAAVVGGAYGGAASLLGGEGDLGERLAQAPLDIGVSAATSGILDRALVGATARQAQAAGQPSASAARRLSRQGVDLLPGQMASEIPAVGPTVKYAEDILGRFNPMMPATRRRQNEQVIRAAGQEALDNVGVTLPRDARTGYQVGQNVMRVLGDKYDQVLPRIRAQADIDVYDDFADLTRRGAQTLDSDHAGRLQRILDENVMNEFSSGGELSGEAFKRIETTLRQQSERVSRRGSTLQDSDLADFLDESRDIVRNMIARQYPEEAQTIRDINRGYATAARIRRAVSGSAAFAREGTPTPGELTQTVQQLSSDAQIMNQTGLLQGLASDARTVLPPGIADTGSGQTAVIGGALGVLGTGGAAAVNPALAAGIASGAIAYSPWGIQALNAIYRATDPAVANQLMEQLYRAASRDPALHPYYQAALEAAQSESGRQSQSPAPAASQPPLPIGP